MQISGMSHNTHLRKALLGFDSPQKVCDFHHRYGDIAVSRRVAALGESVRDFTGRVWEKAHFRSGLRLHGTVHARLSEIQNIRCCNNLQF